MKTINLDTIDLIAEEMANIPEKYSKTNFASTHEAIAVIREEYLELEKEVFWGEKEAIKEATEHHKNTNERIKQMNINGRSRIIHKYRMRSEALQLAAMCVRFVQELT